MSATHGYVSIAGVLNLGYEMRGQNNGYFKLQANGSQTILFAGKGTCKCLITCRGTPTSQILFKRRRVVSQASAKLVMTFFVFLLKITSAMVSKMRKSLDAARNDADLQKRQRLFTAHSLGNTGLGVQNHFKKF